MPLPKLSLQDARTGKRVRVNEFRPGDALVAAPQPILGYCYTTENNWTVYVAGRMPPHLRSAVEQGHTDCEVLLVAELPAGIQEITLPNRRWFSTLRSCAAKPGFCAIWNPAQLPAKTASTRWPSC